MQRLLAIYVVLLATSWAGAQPFGPSPDCPNGTCPLPAGSATRTPAELDIDASAIARIVNVHGATRVVGTGTLIDCDERQGLVITCAHLFREGTGDLRVTFPNQQSFDARLLKTDDAADLAVVAIRSPGSAVRPVTIADAYPRPGDPLVSCGYGGDGRLWCNRGQALGYVTLSGGHGAETLEMTGSARQGDSGGPVFDRHRQLVAVLFGTNGQVVDGTFCGRVRRFLRGAAPKAQFAPSVPAAVPAAPDSPLVQVPPAMPNADAASADRLDKLEQLVSGFHDAWKSISQKIDEVAAAVQQRTAAVDSGTASPTEPPRVELPPGVHQDGGQANSIDMVAEPWLSARLAALLVSLGVPGGVAGVAAGAVVWLVMRRAKQRLQAEVARLKGSAAGGTSTSNDESISAASSTPQVIHQNRYVPFENNVLDKAWADAHAILVEKYPGFRPALEAAERLKNQLLAGVPQQNSES